MIDSKSMESAYVGHRGRSGCTAALLEWLTFWLALHDLGKFSTSFQNQRPDLLVQLQGRSSTKAYSGTRHDSLGELLWRKHLISQADVVGLGQQASRFARRLAPWVEAVTGHHGEPPNAGNASLGIGNLTHTFVAVGK